VHELGAFVEHRPPWLGPSRDARIMQPPPVERVLRPRTTRPDARIREDVCESLTHDGWLDATHIDVTVEAGHVVLDGEVPDRDQKWRAEDHAEHALGVTAVVNRIRVAKRASDDLGSHEDRGTEREARSEAYRRPIGGPTPRW
jgi:hypothetical protein